MERCAQSFGTCRGCEKRILWTRTKGGKAMPCDPELIRFQPCGGNETFVTPDGAVVRGMRRRDGEKEGYISHFATCPMSDKFRKRNAK
ncbi:MAG: hypothetical protein IKM73_07835 [Acidaminococcaceae bacterium]|nr:hypothetical protein [Acidaminococcaceae bacterium]